ncbi:hypothetical protein CK45_07220 [Haemophilus influenzae]|nr:hypothetical protein CK45_07220 [Haemophilus influenzae]
MPFLYFTAVGIPTLGSSIPTLGSSIPTLGSSVPTLGSSVPTLSNQPWVSIPTVDYSNSSSHLGNVKLYPKGVALG